MSDWDNLVEPARAALEALIRKGDAEADRIEELEAKLAKAFEALCLADAALSGANMNTLSMRVVEKSVKSTLAELKGQDDENMHR